MLINHPRMFSVFRMLETPNSSSNGAQKLERTVIAPTYALQAQ